MYFVCCYNRSLMYHAVLCFMRVWHCSLVKVGDAAFKPFLFWANAFTLVYRSHPTFLIPRYKVIISKINF